MLPKLEYCDSLTNALGAGGFLANCDRQRTMRHSAFIGVCRTRAQLEDWLLTHPNDDSAVPWTKAMFRGEASVDAELGPGNNLQFFSWPSFCEQILRKVH